MMKKTSGFLLSVIIILAVNCTGGDTQKTPPTTDVHLASNPAKNAEAVFLFENNGRVILNWTQRDEENRNKNILKYTLFDRRSGRFGPVDSINLTRGLQVHHESMAKMAMNRAGKWWVIFRKKAPSDRTRFGGHLWYAISDNEGKTWNGPFKLVDDTSSASQSFYDVACMPDDRMALSWLDSRSRKRGKTLFWAATGPDGRFTSHKPVAYSTCECCRTDIFIDSLHHIHLAYRNLIEPGEPDFDGKGATEIRDIYYLFSVDSGRTFSKPVRISPDNWHIYGCPHTGPSMAWNGETLGIAWFTAANEHPGIYFTTGNNGNFLPRKFISHEGRHPQITALQKDFYLTYDEYYEQNGKGYYRIILEKIPGGNPRRLAAEISRPLSINDHPVLVPLNRTDSLLVAWVNRDTRHPKIEYRVINVRKWFAYPK